MTDKTPRLHKPRRKHFGWATALESEAGREFAKILGGLVGYFEVTPVATIRNVHVFRVRGERATALAVETSGVRNSDSTWTTGLAFTSWSEPPVQAVLTLRRWDPWLEFDNDVVRAATRQQRRQWEDERLRRAHHSDELVSESGRAVDLLGVTSAELDLCWERAFGGTVPERPLVEDLERARRRPMASTPLLRMTSWAGVKTDVDVEVLENGDIQISGEDYGKSATVIGSSYEFWWTIPASSRRAFLNHLGIDPVDAVDGIVAEYSGQAGWSRLESLLRKHQERFDIHYFSWMSSD